MKAKANGITVNYALEGPATAPVVIVSHSLAAHLGMWEPQVDGADADASACCATTRAATGDARCRWARTRSSSSPTTPWGSWTPSGSTRAHWLGLSLGGMIGQTLALRAPDRLRSLVLCDTTSRVPADAKPLWESRIRTAEAQGMETLVEPTVERWFTPPFRQRRPEVIDRVAHHDPGDRPPGLRRLLPRDRRAGPHRSVVGHPPAHARGGG